MPSLPQPATEPNRKRPARARQHPARHLGRLRCFGVAVMLAVPLFAGTASAIAASPAGTALVALARNPAVPDTALAATLARFPGAAPRRDRAASGERAAHAARYPRAFIAWKLSAGSPR
jgi:hypothetical protein